MAEDKVLEKRTMSLMGRMFCGIEGEGASTVCHGAMYLDGHLTLSEMRMVVKEAMSKDPRFRSVIVPEDLTFQPTSSIDVIQHTFEHTLPHSSTRAEVEDFISDCIFKPFPSHLPPWQYYLLQNPEGKEFKSAIVVRMSHCLGDGMTMVQMLLSMTQPLNAPTSQPLNAQFTRRKPPSNSCLLKLLCIPFRIISYILTIIIATLTPFLPADKDSDIKGKISGSSRVATSAPYSVEEIKQVGKKWGATVNDVVATCVAGAIRRYQLDSKTGSGKAVNVRAIIPMNLRPVREGQLEFGNKIAFVSLPLSITEKNTIKRLRTMMKRMFKIKLSPEGSWNYNLCGIFYYTLPRKVWLWLCQRFTSRFSLVLTNVAGPRLPLAICNKPLVGMIGWVPAGKCGLTVSAVSYAGNLTVGVLADVNVVKQPHKLIQYFEEEWQALKDAAKTA
eukprot:NODE_2042_length_1707_cov_65.684343_g1745_i0.p1 GENE.NODE_2042_length_1707_cov_65.684343_g1745_i0~~NODE_2042_length_1707_cov_65.684343_g1745_i0.p1  ORF type:complete len:444 (+),score=91.41 NODE_2042_length_1707_cov_65.684343_g1745_i0:56-1387(+)